MRFYETHFQSIVNCALQILLAKHESLANNMAEPTAMLLSVLAKCTRFNFTHIMAPGSTFGQFFSLDCLPVILMIAEVEVQASPNRKEHPAPSGSPARSPAHQ